MRAWTSICLALVACTGDETAPAIRAGEGGAGLGGGGASTSSASGGAGGEAGGGGAPVDPCPRVRVTTAPGVPLNVRPDPSTQQPPVGILPSGAVVEVVDQVAGETIDGISLWYEITSPEVDGFIFSGFAECTQDELTEPFGFWLPLECGTSAIVSQGNNSGFSHTGSSAYAFDFAIGVGTPMVAMAGGTVTYTYDQTKPGDPCYDGGDISCIEEANVVVILHDDGTTTIYAHLSEVFVSAGDVVTRGQTVGLSGSTGYSTGRHAHVARQGDCGSAFCDSIPLEFVDAGVPMTGDMVTSMNCP